jgi:hypothetical protein
MKIKRRRQRRWYGRQVDFQGINTNDEVEGSQNSTSTYDLILHHQLATVKKVYDDDIKLNSSTFERV